MVSLQTGPGFETRKVRKTGACLTLTETEIRGHLSKYNVFPIANQMFNWHLTFDDAGHIEEVLVQQLQDQAL